MTPARVAPAAYTSLHRLCCASTLALACAVLLGAGTAAAQEAPRFYAGVSAGYDWSRNMTLRDRSCDPSPQFGLFGCGPGVDGTTTGARGDFGTGPSAELAAGVRLLQAVRVEVAMASRSGLALAANANFAGAGDVQPVAADLTQRSLIARGFWSILSIGHVEAFVGAGLGGSHATVGDVRYSFPGLPSVPSTTRTVGGRGWDRAWDASVGGSVRLRPRTRLDVSYRFSDFGTVQTADGAIEVIRGERVRVIENVAGTRARLSSQGVYVGVRQSLF